METKSLGYTPRRIIMCKQKRGGEKEKKKAVIKVSAIVSRD